MKPLIAIVTCHAPKYRTRADAQRATWVQHAAMHNFDVKFFLGRPPLNETPGTDEIFLDVEDGYQTMPAKVQAVFQWAHAAGYNYVFKTDDDVYVNTMMLQQCEYAPHDYVGRFRGPSGGYPADYASGYGYWVSRRAMGILAAAKQNGDWAEDRWVANTLAAAGVNGFSDDKHYLACYPPCLPEIVFRGPLRSAAAFCEYPPHLMHQMYKFNRATPAPFLRVQLRPVALPPRNKILATIPAPEPPKPIVMAERKPLNDLSKLCVLVKTFLRDGYLFDTVAALQKYFPEVRMIIMDDGKATPAKDALYQRLRDAGHTCRHMPFDSGFGAKSNEAIQYIDRPFVLIASDDFDFNDPDQVVRHGIERMLTVVEGVPEIAIASGRVENNPYEAMLEIGPDYVKEIPLEMGNWQTVGGADYKLCDLTVNYSVIRSNALGFQYNQVHWDGGEVKIGGGEHGAFFLDLKRAGYKAAFVPGANINPLRYNPAKEDPTYGAMRNRARHTPRLCLQKRGIKRWIMRDGLVENV